MEEEESCDAKPSVEETVTQGLTFCIWSSVHDVMWGWSMGRTWVMMFAAVPVSILTVSPIRLIRPDI
jgi:hypothetical protein